MARSRKSIMLGTQTLHGVDRFGEWFTTGVEGWAEPPAPKGNEVERERADGDYWLPSFYSARTPTIDGTLLAGSHSAAIEGMSALNAAASLGGAVLSVMEDGRYSWARARYAGLDYTWTTFTAVRYQLRLKCPDPRKFGEQRRFDVTPGSPAQAFHRGNYAARPIIQINGPFTGGVTITHPAGQFVFLGDLAAGGWVRVDMATGRLKLNGNDRSDLIVRADLFTILPGVVAQVSVNRGVGYVEVLDTFI